MYITKADEELVRAKMRRLKALEDCLRAEVDWLRGNGLGLAADRLTIILRQNEVR